jgi:uncharacterized hydrophobic protein (TIGR00271 family)
VIESGELRRLVGADGSFSLNFIALTLAAAVLATLGLVQNSTTTVIAAMIVAPLPWPIGALAYAAVDSDVARMRRAFLTLVGGGAIAVLFAFAASRIIYMPAFGSEILSRTQPDLLDLAVALTAGAVSAFARIRPSIAAAVAGTAVAVALVTPLCVTGIGLAHGEWNIARGSFLLFLTNLFGIVLAQMCVFIGFGYAHVRRASGGLLGATFAVAVVGIPLALSSHELIIHQTLEARLRDAIVNDRETFRRAQLINSNVDWVTDPIKARLLVRSASPITPAQVKHLEEIARIQTGQDFKIVVDVAPISRVDDESVRVRDE